MHQEIEYNGDSEKKEKEGYKIVKSLFCIGELANQFSYIIYYFTLYPELLVIRAKRKEKKWKRSL